MLVKFPGAHGGCSDGTRLCKATAHAPQGVRKPPGEGSQRPLKYSACYVRLGYAFASPGYLSLQRHG